MMLNYTSMTAATGTTKPMPGRSTMNTDMKWFAIIMIFFIAIPLAGLALSDYHKGQCRIEAIRANMDAEKIAQVCK